MPIERQAAGLSRPPSEQPLARGASSSISRYSSEKKTRTPADQDIGRGTRERWNRSARALTSPALPGD
jgi:hypothetical protein